jgi:hypothetical protein
MLARVNVEGHRRHGCVGGVPDSAAYPALAAAFAQVSENVDRFRLLLDEYPFTYVMAERYYDRVDMNVQQNSRRDSVTYDSRVKRPYAVGQVVYDGRDASGRSTRYMYIPTFRDLADPAFLTAHCFSYRGAEDMAGGGQALRIDFRPTDEIKVPDVEGSIFLDAKRYIVRRAVFRLTRPQDLTPPVAALTVTTAFRELIPLLPLFDSVTAEQPGLPARTDGRPATMPYGAAAGAHVRTAVEVDHLVSHQFIGATPGAPAGASVAVRGDPAATGTAVIPVSASRAQPAGPTVLTGRVVQQDGKPVAGATIALTERADTVTTSDSGRFAMQDVPPGAHMITVRHVGFHAARLPVTVIRGQTRDVTITLTSGVPALSTVRTTAKGLASYHDVGLDKRMQAGIGQFVTYDKIVERRAARFTQLLELVHGLRLYSYDQQNEETQVLGSRGRGACVGFVVDGAPQQSLTTHDIDEIIPADNVAAIEFYHASEAPAGWRAETPDRDTASSLAGVFPSAPQTTSGASSGNVPTRGPSSGPPATTGATTMAQAQVQRATFHQHCDVIAVWTRSRLGVPPTDNTGGAGDPLMASGHAQLPDAMSCEIRPPDDSLALPIYAYLAAAGRRVADSAWDKYGDGVLTALQRSYVLPSDISMGAFGTPLRFSRTESDSKKSPTESLVGVAPAFSTVVSFTLDSTGAASGIDIGASSLSGAADTSALAAVEQAAYTKTFPPMPGSLADRRPVHFALAVTTTKPPPGARAATLGRVSVPLWELKRAVALAPDSQPSLGTDPLPGGVSSDSATIEFVVDENGRAMMSTVRVVGTQGPAGGALVQRVVGVLPKFTFTPEQIGACPVRATITQVFGWKQG